MGFLRVQVVHPPGCRWCIPPMQVVQEGVQVMHPIRIKLTV